MLKKITDFIVSDLTEESLMIDNVLFSPYPYAQEMVKVISIDQKVITVDNVNGVLSAPELVLKIEDYEKLNPTIFNACKKLATHLGHCGPVTCHLFKSPKGGVSFPKHTDPDDVVIHVVSGSKTFYTECGDVTVNAGEWLFISRGLQHQAINNKDSIMLSFGLELFIVDKLYI